VKPASSISTSSPFDDDSSFKTSKRDKRQIKHSTFVSKIEKSRKKPLKRRRPSKRLIASLDSLADALPDAGESGDAGRAGSGIASQMNVIRHNSIKHRPGALKRKEKLDRLERDRFAKNMAQMAVGLDTTQTAPSSSNNDNDQPADTAGTENSATSARWAALRSFISQTMDQNPEFKGPHP
jgi:hypothetical protein